MPEQTMTDSLRQTKGRSPMSIATDEQSLNKVCSDLNHIARRLGAALFDKGIGDTTAQIRFITDDPAQLDLITAALDLAQREITSAEGNRFRIAETPGAGKEGCRFGNGVEIVAQCLLSDAEADDDIFGLNTTAGAR